MQVNYVLVDEIFLDEEKRLGLLRSTLYEFRKPRWVSVHWEREGHRLGPITLFNEFKEAGDLDYFSVREFGERVLHTEGKRQLTISYRDTWTIPPWTVYAIMLPKGFIASHIRGVRQGYDWDAPLEIATSYHGHLFYHMLFYGTDEPYVFSIEARIQENLREYEKLLKSVDVVEGVSRFEGLRHGIGRQLLSTEFWFKLLELGGKLASLS